MTIKAITDYLKTYYPEKHIVKTGQEYQQNIHTIDISLKDGRKVRLRFGSPSHKGAKGLIMWNFLKN